ncbi:helix-turn-helix domain-containing protein [Corallincola spongiicola]|uniref:AraC family transcriptional regulator n=1 Tax=Corallincola spongiicola TaxID=2520508 RepID=A0ABY1WPF9_9GAMM|nr:helix-turn-helix domain-containing protein [Corallincola spongiicola]TAA45837.1 AraC family transcriptional regulator [Corallincola spongiicola]
MAGVRAMGLLITQLGILQGIIIALVVLGKQRGAPVAIISSSLLLTASAYLWVHSGYPLDRHVDYPWLVYLNLPLTLLIPPLLYLYFRCMLHGDSVWSLRLLLHFIPALLALLHIQWLLWGLDDFQRIMAWDRPSYAIGSQVNFWFQLINPIYVGYLLALAWMLYRYQRCLEGYDAGPMLARFHWLVGLLVATALVFLMTLFATVFNQFNQALAFDWSPLLDIGMALVIIASSIWLVWSPTTFFDVQDTAQLHALEQPPKYQRHALSDLEQQQAKAKLLLLIEEQRPYLSANITLGRLADMMQWSTHQTSQVINAGFDENFHQFINRFRVEQAKSLLIQPESSALTVLDIAYQSGFNSKSSFNSFFKKLTGMTPSQFRLEQGVSG